MFIMEELGEAPVLEPFLMGSVTKQLPQSGQETKESNKW